MSLFLGEDDLLDIAIYYHSGKNSKGVRFLKILDEAKAKEWLQSPEKSHKVETLNAKFRQPTWASQQQMFSKSFVYNPGTGKKETEWTLYSDIELKANLVEWDVVDRDGRKLPVRAESIDSLPAAIANELLIRYRSLLAVEDDEMGE
jgi:hypothetical protein